MSKSQTLCALFGAEQKFRVVKFQQAGRERMAEQIFKVTPSSRGAVVHVRDNPLCGKVA